MKRFAMILIAVGILIIVGTAGASDAGTYTLWQSVIGVLAGACVGWIGAKLLEEVN